MVDKEKLVKYIDELKKYIQRLKELKKYSKEEFVSEWRIYDLVERNIHLALENFLNIGEMIISEFSFPKPDFYADIPRILYENKVISVELMDKLVDLARFRNVLVHDYLYLDHSKIYDKFQNIPDTLEEFLKQIIDFIKSREG